MVRCLVETTIKTLNRKRCYLEFVEGRLWASIHCEPEMEKQDIQA